MKTSSKWNIGIAAALVVAATAAIVIAFVQPFAEDPAEAETMSVIEENSHRLDVADDGKVTVVEFLDFECEVCGAVYPAIEQLREEYAGRVTFVVRYFPIPGHQNSMNAAIAVEAAAQQGQFEAMYSQMFDTQAEWGEQQVSKADLFRSFADELGLDLAEYDAAVADPATQERVQTDFDAGLDLGVEGTPTFFVNNEKLTIESIDDLRGAFDQALAE